MTDIDQYLASAPEGQRALLQQIRERMHELLHERGLVAAEEISYGIPCLKVGGKAVGGFAANKRFCSYYPFSGSVLGELAPSLTEYAQAKSALHFTDAQPLTRELLELLIDTRLEQING